MKNFLFIYAILLFLVACDTQRQNNPEKVADLMINDGASEELSARRWKRTSLKNISVFDFQSLSEGKVLAATSDGLYLSKDDGDSWEKMENIIVADNQVSCLEKADSVLFAGIAGYGVFRSYDEGQNWGLVNGNQYPGKGLIVKDILYNEGIVYAGSNKGLYFSEDLGESWKTANKGLPVIKKLGDTLARYAAVNGILKNGKKLVLLTETGLAVSDGLGKGWKYPKHEGLKDYGLISTVANKNNILFAGRFMKDGLYYSADNGESWQRSTLYGYNLYKIFISPNGLIYAGTANKGVLRSPNNGKDWSAFNTGLPKECSIFTFAATESGSILIGTEDYGIFKLMAN